MPAPAVVPRHTSFPSLAMPQLQVLVKALGGFAVLHAKRTSGKLLGSATLRWSAIVNGVLLLSVLALLTLPERAVADVDTWQLVAAQLLWVCVTELLAGDLKLRILPADVLTLDMKRLWQRRRIYLHEINRKWEAYERWEDSATSIKDRLAALAFFGERTATLKTERSSGGIQGVGGLHRIRGTPFLLRPEVASCRCPPEIAEHAQRLLSNQVAKADDACVELPTIVE